MGLRESGPACKLSAYQKTSRKNTRVHLEADIAREVDAVLDAWRSKALGVLLVAVCALTIVPLLIVLSGRGVLLPWAIRGVCVAIYATLLAAALSPALGLRLRALLLLVCIAGFGTLQLLVGQLAGDGRLALLLPPFLALILLGPRAGWAAMAACAALFAGAPLLLRAGVVDFPAPVAGAGAPLAYWGIQWLLWVNKVALLMLLFSLFVRLLRRTMIAERVALRSLEKESANRQRLAREVNLIGELERRRLGAELHDGLCQHLTATLLNCVTAEHQAQTARQPEAAGFGRIRASLEEAIGMAYEVAKGLCPVDLGPDALVPAFEQLCRTVQARHGVACVLQADPALTVGDAASALNLYRIAGEAVANAVKHAHCARIDIELVREAGEVVLRVTDDGKSPASGVSKGGLGQGIMAYRAELIGGKLELEQVPGAGRRVVCRLPVREGAP